MADSIMTSLVSDMQANMEKLISEVKNRRLAYMDLSDHYGTLMEDYRDAMRKLDAIRALMARTKLEPAHVCNGYDGELAESTYDDENYYDRQDVDSLLAEIRKTLE